MSADTIKRITATLIVVAIVAAIVAGYVISRYSKPAFDISSIQSYREIPGITNEEIAAIEKLKSERHSFSYGSVTPIEATSLPIGSHARFTSIVCVLLSGLFDVPFIQEFHERDELKIGIDSGSIDFTSEFTLRPDEIQSYFATHPIAERMFTVFTKKNAVKIASEHDLNGLKLGFYKDTITEQSIHSVYPGMQFRAIELNNAREVAEKLESGEIDAFIVDSIGTAFFSEYTFITKVDTLPLVYTPASMSTANPKLKPFISVMNKYIEAGGISNLYELCKACKYEYTQQKLPLLFTEEEKAYIENLIASGAKVPVALDQDNYPLCFYDKKYDEFYGIAPDILSEVSLLTGLEFEIVTSKNTTQAEMLKMLKSGKAAFISQLVPTEHNKNDFLWPSEPYYVSRYAFLSRMEYPNLETYQIVQSTVGIVEGTAPAEMYREKFPNDTSYKVFDTWSEALDALERGGIDLFMGFDYLLLYQTNFREKAGYKVNISFKTPTAKVYFGFNKNEEILCSIISKVQNEINIERIVQSWANRTYDYSQKLAKERSVYTAAFSYVLALLLVILLLLYVKSYKIKELYKKQGEQYRQQAVTISTIYKSLPDLVVCKDINRKYTSCNSSFEEFAGCKESELIGKTIDEVPGLFERVSEGIKGIDQRVLTENIAVTGRGWLTYLDGSRRYVEIVKAPLIQDKKITGLLGIIRDITGLYDAIEASKKDHERTKLMLDTIPLCCFLVNKERQIVDCNNVAVSLFGFEDKQDLLNRASRPSILLPEYQPDGQPSTQLFEKDIDVTFKEGRHVFERVCRLLDGTPIPVLVTLVRVNFGNDYSVLSYVMDLREHKKMMGEIERQNNLLKAVNSVSSVLLDPDIERFENSMLMSMGIMAKALSVDRVSMCKNNVKDENFYCHEWQGDTKSRNGIGITKNVPYSEAIFGWEETLSRGYCINYLVRDMPPKAQAQLELQGIKSLFAAPVFIRDMFWGYVGFYDCHRERKFTENEELILRSASRMIANALIRNEMTESARDTAKQLEAAIKEATNANKAKTTFLAKMSHEIRTPMNAITGMAELALRANKPDVIHEHVFAVKQASANLLSIINDILDFSKIESGTMKIIPGKYLFSSLLNDVISIVRMRVIDSRINFSVNVDCNIPEVLFGDEVRIRQVLLNILSNAVKYTENGFVSFTAYKEVVDENNINLIMEVTDSGRGIQKKDLKNLFGEYVKFDLEKNKGIEGVGLGLAITHSIVKAMNGDISVYSEYGKGSTFTVTLPQKVISFEKLASVEDPENKKVLVYEHRQVYASSIAFTVDNLGVYCVTASTDSELFEKLSSDTFSFVFVSFELYNNNKDIIQEFGADAKIVILTGFGETIPDKNLSALAMPAHSLSIANILNGVSVGLSYNESKESIARFIAPDAKVLIVDDINTNLKVAKGLLTPYKMQLDLCTSGMEAVEAVKSKQYDMVFMDHKMPEMDGVEATRYIRGMGETDSYFKNLPIVALTANAVVGSREMYMQNGFNDFLSKPIDTVKMNTILENWLPEEKKKISIEENDFIGDPDELEREIAIEIEGVDVSKGISISGGTPELYLETLAVFYEDGLERINKIKKCLETDNIPLYTTYVHALKSALRNIGANMLSDFAKALESAGEHKNLVFIETNNSEFLTTLELLLQDIKRCLSARKGIKKSAKKYLDIEKYRSELCILKEAINRMDGGVITKTVDNLQKITATGEVAVIIRNISNSILLAEYDEAEVLIESLLREA